MGLDGDQRRDGARDLQAKHRQWLLRKSIDGFCPIGPWIVSADQVSPAGVGIGFEPPRFLSNGHVVKVSISQIGTIENRII